MEIKLFKAQRKNNTAPLFVQTICWIMLLWFTLLSITLGLTLRYSLDTFQAKIDDTLRSVVITLASNSDIRECLQAEVCSQEVMEYLDSLVANTADLDMITVADEHSIRIYHIHPERIGEKFVGGDEGRALAGETYFSDATGTMGFQHRAFAPVLDGDGTIIGFVMASTTQDRMNELRNEIALTYGNLILILTVCTLIVSALFAVHLNRILRGARPEDIMRTYLTQNDVLNNLDEGLISLDSDGRIRLVNQAAELALGKREELLVGTDVDSVLLSDKNDSLRKAQGQNLPTNRPNILVNAISVRNSSRWARHVLILKDKSEVMRQAEQLGGTRHIISALRANNHEFMNKLQVISGLLQMGRAQDAQEYIGTLSATHAHTITPVMQLIHNANVAALILGKLDNMRELDIHLTLLNNSSLPEHSRYLSTRELVTVVGNLLENAIEAVNAAQSESRSIVLQLTEDENGLLIMVSDSGEGIDPEDMPRLYELGFSTKAAEGRGVGMGLVKSIVDWHQGSIDVDSEPGDGTTFTLIFNQERGGMRL